MFTIKKFLKLTIIIVFLLPAIVHGASSTAKTTGYILLQVEKNGEAWYVYPNNDNRYYLGRPDDAFNIMKKLALGAKRDYIANTQIFPARLSGLILLDVERNGEAYYIYPKDNRKYYLGRPADAFRIMNKLGLGISNADLAKITIGKINNVFVSVPATSTGTKVLQAVPFTSQAPYGGWSDLRQEDGCEEASSIMAVKWALGESLSPAEALKGILGSSDYTLKKYKEYRDISVTDTVNWIIKDYFNYPNASVKKDITKEEIIAELDKGHIIIAPVNGQLVGNPNYKQPGPPNHMILIRGYDPVKNVFITNDPGTRRGELYEYNTDVFYKAIRAYNTGWREPIAKVLKDVIVVSK